MLKIMLILSACCSIWFMDGVMREGTAAEISVGRSAKRDYYYCHGRRCERYVRRGSHCQIVGACSMFGAYGPDGGPQFWGAYTGWYTFR